MFLEDRLPAGSYGVLFISSDLVAEAAVRQGQE